MTETVKLKAVVPMEVAGSRLDQILAGLFPEYSRSRLQQWVKAGQVTVDGACLRVSDKLAGGEAVHISATLATEVTRVEPEPIALNVVHEDDEIFIIDKPAGLVVHPGAGNPGGTLQNALLHRQPSLDTVPRCGIVHRIDKDTTGLLVVARNLRAHASLVGQIQEKTMGREYDALVNGTFTAGGKVDAPLGRHPKDRKRMAVSTLGGREAVTHYRIKERFLAHTLLRVHLETGRTHQIRVHMSYIRHPLVGDQVYAGRARLPPGADETLREALAGLRRQALHAARLTLVHPATGETMSWDTPRPADMDNLLDVLRAHDRHMAH